MHVLIILFKRINCRALSVLNNLIESTTLIGVKAANLETANRYSHWKLVSKYLYGSCQFLRITASIRTPAPPFPPSPHHSSPANKEPPLGPAVLHHGRSGSVPIIFFTYILSTIPWGEVEHYTAEWLMSRSCPFSSNVVIQSSSIFDHSIRESSLYGGRKCW